MEKRVPTASKVNSLVKITKVYLETVAKSDVVLWIGSATTTGGLATLYLTDNNLETGNALFTNVYTIQATAEKGSAVSSKSPESDPETVPLAGIESLSIDRKTLIIVAIVAVSPKSLYAPDGTKVHALVIGD